MDATRIEALREELRQSVGAQRSADDPEAVPDLPHISDTLQLLSWAAARFTGRIVFAASFGAEDVVLLDLIARSAAAIPVLTLDTGRLPEETHEVMDTFRRRSGLRIETHFPDRAAVAALVSEQGSFSFRESVAARRECCRIRKVEPLRAALRSRDAWITGLRREQAPTRSDLAVLEWDDQFGLVKLNPLGAWSEADVWAYIRTHGVPSNRLHDRGYPSIGCAPCTRAIQPGEDPRAGRWWWERPEQKECGLHRAPWARPDGDAVSAAPIPPIAETPEPIDAPLARTEPGALPRPQREPGEPIDTPLARREPNVGNVSGGRHDGA